MTDEQQQPSGEDERVREIRARAEAATPGPWETWPDGAEEAVESLSVGRFVCHLNSNMRHFREDSAFIAHAREDIPDLLDMISALRARAEAAESALAEERVRADRLAGALAELQRVGYELLGVRPWRLTTLGLEICHFCRDAPHRPDCIRNRFGVRLDALRAALAEHDAATSGEGER